MTGHCVLATEYQGVLGRGSLQTTLVRLSGHVTFKNVSSYNKDIKQSGSPCLVSFFFLIQKYQ